MTPANTSRISYLPAPSPRPGTNSAHTHPAPLPGLLLSRPQACNLTHPPPPATVPASRPRPTPLRAISLRPHHPPFLPHSACPKPDFSSPSEFPGSLLTLPLGPSNFPGPSAPALARPSAPRPHSARNEGRRSGPDVAAPKPRGRVRGWTLKAAGRGWASLYSLARPQCSLWAWFPLCRRRFPPLMPFSFSP